MSWSIVRSICLLSLVFSQARSLVVPDVSRLESRVVSNDEDSCMADEMSDTLSNLSVTSSAVAATGTGISYTGGGDLNVTSATNSSAMPSLTISNSTESDTDVSFHGQFWAGADIGTVMRMEALPGRVFYDFDGTTVKDPIQTLADVGMNAARVEGERGSCAGPTKFDTTGNLFGNELLFKLDWGCADIQVKTAQRAAALGMRIVLTINQGLKIPKELEQLSYAQMVDNIMTESKRQLQPYLDVKIVPDVILLENEGSDGFLMTEESTGHVRGTKDGKASIDKVNQELCGQIPTGSMDSYAQLAGYYKAEIMACNEAIVAAGFSIDTVRYGLHSHGQYVQWKEGVVHGPKSPSQTELKDTTGKMCSTQVIPADLLAKNVSEMLTIAGFSAYPDPMTPDDVNSHASQQATMGRLSKTLTQLQGYAEAYGKFESGPFAGQYKLQGLGVEYSTAFTEAQIPQEQATTEVMWSTVKAFDAFLGMLWYEPWYCYSDWSGGNGALCKKTGGKGITGEVPSDTMKTWGKAAVSPWKK